MKRLLEHFVEEYSRTVDGIISKTLGGTNEAVPSGFINSYTVHMSYLVVYRFVYIYFYIALRATHSNQKRYQCGSSIVLKVYEQLVYE